ILEAMVMKTPVVASDVDGIPELIENGVTGLIFPSDDKTGLLSAILRFYRDPEFRNQLSESGSDRYWSYFSRRHQFERMSVVLEEISRNFP
ncbi:MAG: glycosyltransferase, partial [Deltaproteobacteria bacterium]|nr:glycosyltransferase [Deltaproteobacteria bacterium]